MKLAGEATRELDWSGYMEFSFCYFRSWYLFKYEALKFNLNARILLHVINIHVRENQNTSYRTYGQTSSQLR